MCPRLYTAFIFYMPVSVLCDTSYPRPFIPFVNLSYSIIAFVRLYIIIIVVRHIEIAIPHPPCSVSSPPGCCVVSLGEPLCEYDVLYPSVGGQGEETTHQFHSIFINSSPSLCHFQLLSVHDSCCQIQRSSTRASNSKCTHCREESCLVSRSFVG